MKVLNTTYATADAPLMKDDLELHVEILQKMVQAAVSLEEFTIPLYMCSMYSLVGTHQITSKNAFYRGVWYPGAAISANPDKWVYDASKYTLSDKIPIYETQANKNPNRVLFRPSNNIAFNLIYKIFIEEMLHLQMAANLAKILGINPCFTNDKLVEKESYAWNCFKKNEKGEYSSIIPYIVDLTDTKSYKATKVKLGPLDKNQIDLFLAIEQPEEEAKEELENAPKGKYFMNTTEVVAYYKEKGALPLFGSIGHLYQTLWDFLHLSCKHEHDGTPVNILLDYVLLTNDKPYPQRELFNLQKPGHPIAEYPGFDTTLHGDVSEYVLEKIKGLINAITEQGEGSSVAKTPPKGLTTVAPQAQVSRTAIKRNYTSYDDQGDALAVSPRVGVRAGMTYTVAGETFNSTDKDHDEIFNFIKDQLMQQADFMTWDQWHDAKEVGIKNEWTTDLLTAKDYVNNTYKDKLPKPEEIAAAMNRLKNGSTKEKPQPNEEEAKKNYIKMCKVATGAVWGIIHVLDKYWSDTADSKMQFPYPAMGGTGDRMSICWSVFGKVPDLSVGLEPDERRKSDIVNHACQGLAAINPDPTIKPGANDCAEVAMYHTCKGSNLCRAEGGCGFVQAVGGGSNCGASTSFGQPNSAHKDSVVTFSAPGDNACGGQGGCAVPISASQLYPEIPKEGQVSCGAKPWGKMELFDFKKEEGYQTTIKTVPIIKEGQCHQETIPYNEGDGVYNIAWEAYLEVLKHRKIDEPKKPEPNDIRLAFPPST